MAVAGLTCRGAYAGSGRTRSPETPKLVEAPINWGPRLHEEGFRHRGAGWEAIRSHLGRTCPRYEGNGVPSFLHAPRYRPLRVVS